MQTIPIVLLGVVITLACVLTQQTKTIKPTSVPQREGAKRLVGIIALSLAVLILLNPELLALGLLGDAAFFDVLVLLLTLQLQSHVDRVWRCVRVVFSPMMRVMIPRLSMEFSLVVLAFAPIGNVVSAIQKTMHRVSL